MIMTSWLLLLAVMMLSFDPTTVAHFSSPSSFFVCVTKSSDETSEQLPMESVVECPEREKKRCDVEMWRRKVR